MKLFKFVKWRFMLLLLMALFTSCSGNDVLEREEENFENDSQGVLILNEGNYQAGNSTLSYYNPDTRKVENGVFQRANDRKLGDTGQSITLYNGTVYITMENSGIIWGIDPSSFKVKGQFTKGTTEMINPRYVHFVNSQKAYVSDLYSKYITIFNPQTYTPLGSIDVSEASNLGYCSTEEMVQYSHYVFVNCWSYSNKILVIDTDTDKMDGEIELTSWQPKSMCLDANNKIWVITDGGYSTGNNTFSDNVPHLYRIDAATRTIELDQALETDEANVQIELSPKKDVLYVINNDIYRMGINEAHLPVKPLIYAPTDKNGKRHKLYGIGVNPHNGEIYVADAVDYSQAGKVYRYSSSGLLLDSFSVGITPNHFCFQ